MALTHAIIRGWQENGVTIQRSTSFTGGAEINIDSAISGGATTAFEFALDTSRTQSFFAVADQAVTLKTNNYGAPANTVVLAAGAPFIWTTGGAALADTSGSPMSNITSLFAVNGAATTAANLSIRALYNP